jgi:YHS domain-containing protein
MAMVKDPVCGMELDSSQAQAQTIYKGQAYFFCSADCRRTFDDNPKEFVGKGTSQGGEPLPPLQR